MGLQVSLTMALPLQWGAALQAGLQAMALMHVRLTLSQLTTQGSSGNQPVPALLHVRRFFPSQTLLFGLQVLQTAKLHPLSPQTSPMVHVPVAPQV
ncbi:MAG TPA: hypothetical protein VGG33_03290 [Polyangia bacterium]